MSSTGDINSTPVRMMCARRAHHTYEVTFTREPTGSNANYSSRITDVMRRLEERKNRMDYNSTLPAATGDGVSPDIPRKLTYPEFGQYKGTPAQYRRECGDDSLPRSDSMGSVYHGASSGRYRSGEPSETETPTATGTLKSARSKLIQFLQTEEFFDEYSFIALMALLLAHMYRLSHAIFEMGCTAQTILGVFIYVWRFMQARVADILTTCGGPQAAYKCAVFCAELIVIFTSILLFLWAVFVPACSLIAVIASKLLYLFM